MRPASCLTASAALAVALAGCDVRPDVAGARPADSLKLRPGYVVDSIFPMEEMLRRFRSDIGDAPASLTNGASSPRALIRELVQALAADDARTLRRLRIDRAEFAWLYFPASPFISPPYELPPEILWLQIDAESGKGLTRAMRAVEAGASYVDHACGEESRESGRTKLWDACTVRWRRADGAEERSRLFGSILEHEGRFKFVSYANPL